jgi:hypothetical protein
MRKLVNSVRKHGEATDTEKDKNQILSKTHIIEV